MKYFAVMLLLYAVSLFINLELALAVSSHFISDVAAHPLHRYLWMIGIYLFAFFLFKLMTNRMSRSGEPLQILKADLLSLVIIFSILFIIKQSESYSRFIVMTYFLLNLLIPFYIVLFKQRLFNLPWLREPVLIVGDANGILAVRQWLEAEFSGFDSEELLLDGEEGQVALEERLKNDGGKYYAAAIAADALPVDGLFRLTETVQHFFSRVIVIPNLGKFPLINAKILGSIEHKGIAFSVPNNLLNPYDRVLKNSFDTMVSIGILLVIAPFLLVLYILVWIASGGHPVYRQQRVGHNGRPFYIYKFTSMRPDADVYLEKLLENDPVLKAEWVRERKLKNDPRITKLGKFMRQTSLDELPQLLNVLRGEMSLVGPRPIVEEEVGKYGEYFRYYAAVRPGITGLWQVSGRNDVSYDERVQLDVWYVRNWSVDLDLMILLKTFNAVLKKQGSY
jgi:undecaprenyl-phosphate galactose phosphotransferase